MLSFIAAIIAGEMKLNDDADSVQQHKTFAFDVLNGAVGYLDGLRSAVAMLRGCKMDAAMVCSSEIESNADYFSEQITVQNQGQAKC